MPFRLLVRSKAQTGPVEPQEIRVHEDAIAVGRDKACQVLLADPAVSRRHLSIVREGALYFVADLGSSFGTRVNGEVLPAKEKRLLRDGDVLAVGPYDLTFDSTAPAAADAQEPTSFIVKREIQDALRGLAVDPPFLRAMNGPLEGRRFEIQEAQELVIGREPGVDIVLDDDLTSRRHARVRRDWSGTYIEDLGSRNGVRLNRKAVAEARLSDRDEIEIGGTRILFIDPGAVPEPAAAIDPPAPHPEPAATSDSPAQSSAPPEEARSPGPAAAPPQADLSASPSGPGESPAPAWAEPASAPGARPPDSAELPPASRPRWPGTGAERVKNLIELGLVLGAVVFVLFVLAAVFSS